MQVFYFLTRKYQTLLLSSLLCEWLLSEPTDFLKKKTQELRSLKNRDVFSLLASCALGVTWQRQKVWTHSPFHTFLVCVAAPSALWCVDLYISSFSVYEHSLSSRPCLKFTTLCTQSLVQLLNLCLWWVRLQSEWEEPIHISACSTAPREVFLMCSFYWEMSAFILCASVLSALIS